VAARHCRAIDRTSSTQLRTEDLAGY
jgi:hypothetical protein